MEPIHRDPVPPYVWACLALGAFVLLMMTACGSAPRPPRPDHYGWSAPNMAPLNHKQPGPGGRLDI